MKEEFLRSKRNCQPSVNLCSYQNNKTVQIRQTSEQHDSTDKTDIRITRKYRHDRHQNNSTGKKDIRIRQYRQDRHQDSMTVQTRHTDNKTARILQPQKQDRTDKTAMKEKPVQIRHAPEQQDNTDETYVRRTRQYRYDSMQSFEKISTERRGTAD